MAGGRPWMILFLGRLLFTAQLSTQCAEEFFIVNKSTNKCIDVQGYPGIRNRAKIQSWDCELNIDNTDQLWTMDYYGRIINKVSGKCLDIPGHSNPANGVNLQLYSCEGPEWSHTDHLWTLVPADNDNNVFQIRNNNTDKCVDVAGWSSTTNGANIQQYECEPRYHSNTDHWWFKVFPN